METAHSGFVQPLSTPKSPIYDEERTLQTPQPLADSSLSSDVYSEELDTIETNITKKGPEFDVNTTNLNLESLEYSDFEESTPWI